MLFRHRRLGAGRALPRTRRDLSLAGRPSTVDLRNVSIQGHPRPGRSHAITSCSRNQLRPAGCGAFRGCQGPTEKNGLANNMPKCAYSAVRSQVGETANEVCLVFDWQRGLRHRHGPAHALDSRQITAGQYTNSRAGRRHRRGHTSSRARSRDSGTRIRVVRAGVL